MERITLWLSSCLCAALAIFSVSSSANVGSFVTLKLSFDQYSIPHTIFIINGNPVYAMIDTGSAVGFHLHESQLNKIKGLKKARTYRSTDGSGKIRENIEYLTDSLDVNGLQLKNVTVTPFKQWGMTLFGKHEARETPVAGLGAFKDKQILLDYASNSLTISDDLRYHSLIKKNFKEFPLQITSDGMAFEVEQSGHKYHLILDTGATVSLVWNERLKSYKPASCLMVDPEMDNKGCEATMFAMKSNNGTSEHFGAVVVAGEFKHMGNIDGLIGNNFLKNRKVLIDFKNNKVFISNDQRKG